MGVQGNYPGSGAYSKHYTEATGGNVEGSNNMDTHLKEGGSSGSLVDDPKMPVGKGSMGDVKGVNQE